MECKKKGFIIISIISFLALFTIASTNSENTPKITVKTNPQKTITKKQIFPADACNYFSETMPTEDYKDYGYSFNDWGDYGTYGCNSDLKKLDGFLNSISYYVEGDSDIVNAVSLDLDIHNYNYESTAIKEMIKDSNILVTKVTGKTLPKKIKQSILSKKEGVWRVNGYKVKLIKEVFTKGDGGLCLTFLIEV